MSLLRHPLIPGLLATLLLAVGAWLGVYASLNGEDIAITLTTTFICGGMLLLLTRKAVLSLPALPPSSVKFMALMSGAAIFAELAIFGVPLLGQIDYNEFGLPVVHHLAASQWALPLFARKKKFYYLLYALVVAVILFSRQMILMSVIAYLMSSKLKSTKLVMFLIVGAFAVLSLGYYRNEVIGINLGGGLKTATGLDNASYFDFVILYLLGPLVSTFGDPINPTVVTIFKYWNTAPEWYDLTTWFNSPPLLSLVLFYAVTAAISFGLNRSKLWSLRVLSVPFHVISFFCFFSHTLFTTPIIGVFLIIIICSSIMLPALPEGPGVASLDA